MRREEQPLRHRPSLLGVMTLLEHLDHLLQGMPLGHQQDDVMVHQVGALVQEQVAVVVLGLDDHFDRLLAYLLGHLVDAPGDQARRVGLLGIVGLAVVQEVHFLVQILQLL